MKRIILLLFCLMMSLCEGSINFVHIPKTGGTTIQHLLEENFPAFQIYPFTVLSKARCLATSTTTVEEVFNEFPMITQQVIMGHFPIWFLKEKDPNFATSYFFTVLRDPIERVLSHDRFLVAIKYTKTCNPLNIPANMMCRLLASDCALQGEELLEDAIKSLHRMDFIIFMDEFEQGVRKLFAELGLALPRELPRYHMTEKHPIDEEIIEKLKELNALDIQLYEYANQHFR